MLWYMSTSSCFTLAIPMLEVSCVKHTHSAWDPRSLQSILDSPLFIVVNIGRIGRGVSIDLPIGSITIIILNLMRLRNP